MKIILRQEAKNKGLNYFFTGKPCKRGHFSKRRVVSKSCWECQKLWKNANRKYNPKEKKREVEKGAGRATQIVFCAVKNGKLKNLKKEKVICVDCEVQRATMYDHRDYNKPLDVDPVCNRCNQARGPATKLRR